MPTDRGSLTFGSRRDSHSGRKEELHKGEQLHCYHTLALCLDDSCVHGSLVGTLRDEVHELFSRWVDFGWILRFVFCDEYCTGYCYQAISSCISC